MLTCDRSRIHVVLVSCGLLANASACSSQGTSAAPSRTRRLRRWLCALSALAAVMQLSPPARGALGDDVAAVAKDRARMQANLHIQQRGNYEVHELATPIGTTVREFVGQDSKVFAVSWSGGWRPNLRDIMGAHYDRFIDGTRGKLRARGPVRIDLPGMVVVMGGHLRTFFGQVYLTDLLPVGVQPQDLR
jgi:hypothetical protein